jgi:hypothetical protein
VSLAFLKAERARRYRKGVTHKQRRTLERLARLTGVEVPQVAWRDEASEAITRLENRLRQATLGVSR